MATFETLTMLTEKIPDGSITVSDLDHEIYGRVIEIRGDNARGPIPPFLLDLTEVEVLRRMIDYMRGTDGDT